MKETTSQRLKYIMRELNLKQVDVIEKSKPYQKELNVSLGKSALSQYVNGKSVPYQGKLTLLSKVLGVTQPWLMGYDVPMTEHKEQSSTKTILDNIFNKLEKPRQEIDTNPAISVVAPKIKRELKEDKNFYDHDELKKFMSLAEKTGDIQKIALFRVLAFTGIRKGELLALEWSDLHDNTLEINKAISRSQSGLEVSTTKNSASERLISLDRKTIEILDNLREEYPDRKLIFESENGGVLSPAKPRKWLLQIIKGSNLRQITIHGFRHTHAGLIFESGMTLKQAQHRLGHSDLQTTMNIYTHITQKAIDDIGEKFSKYVDF